MKTKRTGKPAHARPWRRVSGVSGGATGIGCDCKAKGIGFSDAGRSLMQQLTDAANRRAHANKAVEQATAFFERHGRDPKYRVGARALLLEARREQRAANVLFRGLLHDLKKKHGIDGVGALASLDAGTENTRKVPSAPAPGIGADDLIQVPSADVYPDPVNPREAIDWDHVAALADSIEAKGFLPQFALTVRKVPAADWRAVYEKSPRAHDKEWIARVKPDAMPRTGNVWVIVDGEHRLHAARSLGVPVYVRPFTGSATDAEAIQIAGNTGKPWTDRELTQAVKRWVAQGLDAAAIKKLTGKNMTWVAARMKIAELPAEAINALPYASVSSLVKLAGLFELVGKQHFPDRAAVERAIRSTIAEWDTAGRPAGMIERLTETWIGDSGQFMAFGGSPVPTDEEVQTKEVAGLIGRYRDNVADLTGALKLALARWQQEHPGGDLAHFVTLAAQRAGTRISGLIDRLGMANQATRELLCQLCIDGQDSAACSMCDTYAGDVALISQLEAQPIGPLKQEPAPMKKKSKKAGNRPKTKMYRTKDGRLTTKARYMAGRRLAALSRKKHGKKAARKASAKRPAKKAAPKAARKASPKRPAAKRTAPKRTAPRKAAHTAKRGKLLAVTIKGVPTAFRYVVKRWLAKGEQHAGWTSTSGKDIAAISIVSGAQLKPGDYPSIKGWKLAKRKGETALLRMN